MKFKQLIYKYFDSFETIFLVLFAAGFILLYMQIEYSKYIFASGAGAMALLYWFKAIERNSNDDNISRYSQKLVWYALMNLPAALYSKINMYDKSNLFLLASIALLLIALILRIVQKINKKINVPVSDLMRLVLAIIIGLSIFALPLTK